MKKKPLIIVFAALFVFALTSCGKKNEELPNIESESSAVAEDNVKTDEDAQNENVKAASIEWEKAYDFNEGLAWIKFIENKTMYCGVINKNGEMLSKFVCNDHVSNVDSDDSAPHGSSYDNVDIVSYSNGYSYLVYSIVASTPGNAKISQRFDVIDTAGNIMYSQNNEEDVNEVRAYGDGYMLAEEHYADFDSNGYTYKIYSPKGEVIKTIEAEDKYKYVQYLGKGVFLCGRTLYFTTTGKELETYYEFGWDDEIEPDDYELALDDIGTAYFYEDKAVLKIDYNVPEGAEYRGWLRLLNLNGEIEKIELYPDMGWNWGKNPVKNNLCVLKSDEKRLITYNLTNKSFSVMSEDAADKVDWDNIEDNLMFDEYGRIALKLKGSDNEAYVALFDTDWNMVTEPYKINNDSQRGDDYSYSDGRLIVSNKTETDVSAYVYDSDGELIYKSSDLGYFYVNPYSDGAVCVSKEDDDLRDNGINTHLKLGFIPLKDGEMPQYIDLNGNLLFDEIDMSRID